MLEEEVHEARAVTLTGMGERVHLTSKDVRMETAIQDVLKAIEYNDPSDFVLLGQSFAGKVVAAVADRVLEKARLFLYLDAFRPSKVRTRGGLQSFGVWTAPPGSWKVPFTERILDAIGEGVQGSDREWMLSKATSWPTKHSIEPIALSENFDAVKSA